MLSAPVADPVDVVAIRRDLHAHPELAFAETRTTDVIVGHLRAFGLEPRVLPTGTGAGKRTLFRP